MVVVSQWPTRRRIVEPPASLAAAAKPRHVRFGPAFVDKDESRGIDLGGLPPPLLALPLHVGTILLSGPKRLFLRRYPNRWSVLQTAAKLQVTPVRSRNSSSVASGCCSTNFSSRSRTRPTKTGLRPRWVVRGP
jgi:hypothetical protein